MIKIDFSKFPMYADIEHSRKEEVDIRKGVANRIYTTIAGITAHELAFRILRSSGPIELDADDIATMKLFAASEGTPAFQDSLAEILK